MKKIIVALLMLILFCSCGANGRHCDVPPQQPKISNISEKGITVISAEVENKTEEVYEKFAVQRWEEDRWILVEPIDENMETVISYFANEGEYSEYRIDFTEFFGELPKGKYRIIFGSVEPEESGKYRNIGYTRIEFEIK